MKNFKLILIYLFIIAGITGELIIEKNIKLSSIQQKIAIYNTLISNTYLNIIYNENYKKLKPITTAFFDNYNSLNSIVIMKNNKIIFAANKDYKLNSIFTLILNDIKSKTLISKRKEYLNYNLYIKIFIKDNIKIAGIYKINYSFLSLYLRNFVIGLILILILNYNFIINKFKNKSIPYKGNKEKRYQDSEYKEENFNTEENIDESISHYKILFEDNKKLEEEIENLTTFREVGLAINSILNFKQMLLTIMNVLMSKMDIEKIVIYLINEEKNMLEPIIGKIRNKVIEEEEIREDIIIIGAGNIGKAMEEHSPIIVKDFNNNSLLICPLIAKGELIGSIKVENKLDEFNKEFTEEDKHLLQLLSSQIALALNNARLYEMAITDGLTKLYVHRHFQFKLNEEILRSKRSGKPLSLIMLDIDHFKRFNDTYGHQTGDFVLKEISKILKNMFRATDSAFRYGGEEMAVILPETDSEDAYILAEKLREKIMNHNFLTSDGKELKVTVSLGVASFYPDKMKNMSNEKLIKMADKALYYSKENGRNRTTLFKQEEFSSYSETNSSYY